MKKHQSVGSKRAQILAPPPAGVTALNVISPIVTIFSHCLVISDALSAILHEDPFNALIEMKIQM